MKQLLFIICLLATVTAKAQNDSTKCVLITSIQRDTLLAQYPGKFGYYNTSDGQIVVLYDLMEDKQWTNIDTSKIIWIRLNKLTTLDPLKN